MIKIRPPLNVKRSQRVDVGLEEYLNGHCNRPAVLPTAVQEEEDGRC